jgi:hypothetical protein
VIQAKEQGQSNVKLRGVKLFLGNRLFVYDNINDKVKEIKKSEEAIVRESVNSEESRSAVSTVDREKMNQYHHRNLILLSHLNPR